jgi:polysaccharide biosynthesis/export protein
MPRVAVILMAVLLANCGTYKQNIMFRTGENYVPPKVAASALSADRNYVIQKNDFLTIEIYTNNGERLVDPNPELSQSQQVSSLDKNNIQYLVDLNGVVKFPMVGEVKVEGLTLRQAELMLQKEFEKYFKSPFVTLKFNNKRVVVLGAPTGQVIPLANENMTLAEVLALAKGVTNEAKAHNMRLIRGDQVFLIDFSTVDGYQKTNMIMEPGDILYVEPVRKPLAEGIRDYSIFLTIIVTVTSLITILARQP